jgi:hypothetical protein
MKKLYGLLFILVLLSTYSYGQKSILFVGRDALGAYAADGDLYDSLTAWGYVPEYIMSSEFKTADITVYDTHDGVFLDETISSGDVTAFGATHNYPLPAVNLEGYAPRVDRWNWLTDNTTQFYQTPDGTGSEDDKVIVIKDNSHYITKIFNVDDEVGWSNATGTDTAQNEPTSWKEVNVTYTNKLAKHKAHIANYPDFWTMITIDSSATFPNRMFLWGMNAVGLDGDGQLLHLGTPEFFTIIKRACDWAFDEMEEPSSVPENLSQVDYKLVAFPVPSSDQVTIRFNAPNPVAARITLFNVAGQQLEILLEKSARTGNNFVVLDANKYPGGMYYVRLEIEGRTEFAKIIIN